MLSNLFHQIGLLGEPVDQRSGFAKWIIFTQDSYDIKTQPKFLSEYENIWVFLVVLNCCKQWHLGIVHQRTPSLGLSPQWVPLFYPPFVPSVCWGWKTKFSNSIASLLSLHHQAYALTAVTCLLASLAWILKSYLVPRAANKLHTLKWIQILH